MENRPRLIRISRWRRLIPVFFTIAILVTGNVIAVKTPDIVWKKVLGGTGNDRAFDFQGTSDGGCVIIGDTTSNTSGDVGFNHGMTDILVVKVDGYGQVQWQKVFGGYGYESGNSIDLTSDEGYIFTGSTDSNGTGDVGTKKGQDDLWLVKLNREGVIQWQQVIGGPHDEWGEVVRQTRDGGYILGGVSWDLECLDEECKHYTKRDGLVVKTDNNGEVQWEKILGGIESDYIDSVFQTDDDGYMVMGSTWSNNTGKSGFNNDRSDIWLIKLDKSGNVQWQNLIGGLNDDEANVILPVAGGNILLFGDTDSILTWDPDPLQNCGDVLLLGISSSGKPRWEKTLGGRDYDFGYEIEKTRDGGYIFIGMTRSYSSADENREGYDLWAVKLNEAYIPVWKKILGGNGTEYPAGIRQTPDGGYILAGFTDSNESGDVGKNHGENDFWAIKLDNSDMTPWQKAMDSRYQIRAGFRFIRPIKIF